jgi:phage terminase Nu1 subunit (DNA packaging protein)
MASRSAKIKRRNRIIVDTATLAAHFNLSPRRIRQLSKDGMPKIGRDQFDFAESAAFYVRFLENALANKGAPVGDDSLAIFRGQKARSLLASTELKEFELEKKRASLVTREDADKVFAEFRKMVRARISTVPAPLAKELLGEKSQVMVQAKIERALEAALTLLATVDGPEFAKNLA